MKVVYALESSIRMAGGKEKNHPGPGRSPNPDFFNMIRRRRKVIYEMRPRDIQYDETWRDIMKEVSYDLGVPYEDVEAINTAWWRYVNEMMCHPALPQICMTYLGRLVPSGKILKRYCDDIGERIGKIYRGEHFGGVKRTVGDAKKMEVHLKVLRETSDRLDVEEAAWKKMMKDKWKKVLGDDFGDDKALRKRTPVGILPKRLETTMKEARELKEQLKNQNTDDGTDRNQKGV
jgi:hypothetical protein